MESFHVVSAPEGHEAIMFRINLSQGDGYYGEETTVRQTTTTEAETPTSTVTTTTEESIPTDKPSTTVERVPATNEVPTSEATTSTTGQPVVTAEIGTPSVATRGELPRTGSGETALVGLAVVTILAGLAARIRAGRQQK